MFSLTLLVHKMHHPELLRLGCPPPDTFEDLFIFNFTSEQNRETFCNWLGVNGISFFVPVYEPV